MTAAYGAALRSKGGKQTYLNEKVFAAEMDRICTIDTESFTLRIAEQDGSGGPKLTM